MLRELKEKDYQNVYDYLVTRLFNYAKENNLKSLILGISGGIDSTVVASIASKVSETLNIPLIGRSLTIKNKKDETTTADLVGKSFCSDYKEINLKEIYKTISEGFFNEEKANTLISEGNIMARLRMMYLYNLAGINKGIVLDTDNLTEHFLGFWTIHGDEGDYNPIGGLWKTEIYKLAEWIFNYTLLEEDKKRALIESIKLIPTDGNGISNSDLDQIGGKDYFEVDKILRPLVVYGKEKTLTLFEDTEYNKNLIEKINSRYLNSSYKRLTNRVIRVERNDIFKNIKY